MGQGFEQEVQVGWKNIHGETERTGENLRGDVET